MPPKRKKRSKSMPKQSQSQRQSVVVNIGTSKTKSKPRKSRGRGGLPPPSYQHNLAPTFVTQQATDYNPVIGAIASLTSRLQQEPRIQNPVTPLSSTTSFSTQQAQAMAGQMAEERRDGQTADSFLPHASQVRTATVDYVMPRETIGTNRPTRIVTADREADEYTTEQLVKSTDDFQRLPSDKRASEKSDSSSNSEGAAAGGGGLPRVFKSSPSARARSQKQTQERKEKLDLIRGKIQRGEPITTEERKFVNKTAGTKKIQESLDFVD